MEKDWYISIISTDYDLRNMRSSLIEKIINLNFKPIAFEEKDFPVNSGIHSHDCCLEAIDYADIVILVIDKRYGGIYINSDKSITEEEYNKAIGDKIIIPCVNENSWNERFHSQNNENHKVSYVENKNVLEFIDKVHKNDIDNFIIIYKDQKDLKEKIEGRLKGLTKKLLSKIVEQQVQKVKAIKTSTGMRFSLGDVLQNGYFVEPPYSIGSGSADTEKITDLINILQKENLNICLTGGPGIGKSTLIAKGFIEHAEKALSLNSKKLPFFLSLRSKGAEYSFNLNEYFKECFKEIGKKEYPSLDDRQIDYVFYIDGFDELTENIADIDFKEISSSSILLNPFILSCRTRFSKNYLNNANAFCLTDKFNFIVELCSWEEKNYSKYINVFCEKQKKSELEEKILEFLAKSKELEEIKKNPLLITLFLWIVEEGDLELPLDINSRYALFEKCLESWVNKEVIRSNPTNLKNFEKIFRKSLDYAAWFIYTSRFYKRPLKINTFNSELKNNYEESKEVIEKEAFKDLFEINYSLKEVKGMLHEFFLEYLVASFIVKGFINKCFPFPDCLKIIIRPEINQIIRSECNTNENTILSKIISNLWDEFQKHTHNNEAKESITLRNQATYYIGRISCDDSSEYLERADKKEENISVKLSIAFGLIKNGNCEFEQMLMQNLKNNIEWDRKNRGYHLIYYHDWKNNDLSNNEDPENIPWDYTFNNLLRHLESTEKRHVLLRRIELFTIKRFIETRNSCHPLNQEIFYKIEDSILKADIVCTPKDFSDQIIIEFKELKSTWEQIRGNINGK